MIDAPSVKAHPKNPQPELPILIAGPTGSGKSAFAVELALRVGGEIICADALQIYAGLAVLTAQPGAADLAAVPHHLYGETPPTESRDVVHWLRDAETKVADISRKGNTPLLVGGTGLYLKAFSHGLDSTPGAEPDLRNELEALSLQELTRRLVLADPAAPGLIDLRNPRRVQRALEIVLTSGRPLADFRSAWSGAGRPLGTAVWLQRERSDLHKRIAANVDQILSGGAIEEVRTLRRSAVGITASGAIGLTEIGDLLDGRCSLPECREAIFHATCQYARRQETWFRRQKNFTPLPCPPEATPGDILQKFGSFSQSPSPRN
jgi:tRNA dimethylallyltransferase